MSQSDSGGVRLKTHKSNSGLRGIGNGQREVRSDEGMRGDDVRIRSK